MRTVTFTEFRRKASEMLDLVENGETVRVLRHGKPVARVVPDDGDAVSPLKRPGLHLAIPGLSLSRAVLEERESSF